MIEFDYLSFGAGVQTTAILCLYKEEKVSFKKAIFADTGAETDRTYAHVENLKNLFPDLIITTKKGNIIDDTFKEKYITAPVFTEAGGKGRRSCTSRYKIFPVSNKIRKIENLRYKRLKPEHFTLGLGFSIDEEHRAKPNKTRWLKNVFPLLELNLSRSDCLNLLKRHNIEAIRSACYFCPFHSNKEWRDLKKYENKEFEKACDYDNKIRNLNPKSPYQNYLHNTKIPLNKVIFDDKQIDMFSINDCESGYCGT